MIRYRSRRPDDTALRERLLVLAGERKRFGYRRLYVLLRQEGQAREALARWIADDNHCRPHSAIGYQTPAAYAARLTATDDRLRVVNALPQPTVAPSAREHQSEAPAPVSVA